MTEKIVDNLFNHINSKVDIERVILDFGSAGITERSGEDSKVKLFTQCPFSENHKGQEFTLEISRSKKIFLCRECPAFGDSIGYVARIKNISPVQAIGELVKYYNLKISKEMLDYHTPEAQEKRIADLPSSKMIALLRAEKLHDNSNYFRAQCPPCGSMSNFVISPGAQRFYCFKCKYAGTCEEYVRSKEEENNDSKK